MYKMFRAAFNDKVNTNLLLYRTEFRSQESEWAKRPATANRMNFVRLADSAALANPRGSE